MQFFKRIGLFVLTNILIMVTIGIVWSLISTFFGLGPMNGSVIALMAFCLVMGMSGAFISKARCSAICSSLQPAACGRCRLRWALCDAASSMASSPSQSVAKSGFLCDENRIPSPAQLASAWQAAEKWRNAKSSAKGSHRPRRCRCR